jgi:hypothetical protein
MTLTAVATTVTDVSQSDAQSQVHDLLESFVPSLRDQETTYSRYDIQQ